MYNISVEMKQQQQSGADPRQPPASHGAVMTKAVLGAASRLGVSNKALAAIIGLSEATVSRMGSGSYMLTPGDKAFDLAVLFVRLFRALDALAHGDEDMAHAWLRNECGHRPRSRDSAAAVIRAATRLSAAATRVASRSASYARGPGIRTVNVVPRPGCERTSIVPP